MIDPTSLLVRSSATTPRSLIELTDYRALVLLGEPGIGKSTTLLEEAERIDKQAVAEDTISIHVDLRAYSSETLLHKKVFESAAFMSWAQGTSRLVLHLDSLDEALLRIDSIANLLADELPRYSASRLFLRIACRTAVGPAGILETALNDLWGEAAVGVFELAPLRKRRAPDCTLQEAQDRLNAQASAIPAGFMVRPLVLDCHAP